MIRSISILFSIAAVQSIISAGAYELSPIVAQFSSEGPGSSRSFVIRNTHQQPIALQIEVFKRSADALGNETREPEYDDFIVTPPQMVIAPGNSQSIRAQWVGEANPETELAYRFVVTQLPIRFERDNSDEDVNIDVAMGYKYEAAIYVLPDGGKPSAEVSKSEAILNEDGEETLRVTINSVGERRAILISPTLSVTGNNQNIDITGEALAPLNNKNILAGTQTVVELPWPESLPFGDVSATLKTQYFSQ